MRELSDSFGVRTKALDVIARKNAQEGVEADLPAVDCTTTNFLQSIRSSPSAKDATGFARCRSCSRRFTRCFWVPDRARASAVFHRALRDRGDPGPDRAGPRGPSWPGFDAMAAVGHIRHAFLHAEACRARGSWIADGSEDRLLPDARPRRRIRVGQAGFGGVVGCIRPSRFRPIFCRILQELGPSALVFRAELPRPGDA